MLGGSNLRADSWDAIAKTRSLLSYGSLESLANLTQKSETKTNGESSIIVFQKNYLIRVFLEDR
jgi:filamin